MGTVSSSTASPQSLSLNLEVMDQARLAHRATLPHSDFKLPFIIHITPFGLVFFLMFVETG